MLLGEMSDVKLRVLTFSLKVGGSWQTDKHHSLCGELVECRASSQPPGRVAAGSSSVFMGGRRPAAPLPVK